MKKLIHISIITFGITTLLLTAQQSFSQVNFGVNTLGAGLPSSLGTGNSASGDGSLAIGSNTNASGAQSFAAGANTVASGFASTALGSASSATGPGGSFSAGLFSQSSGVTSFSLGSYSQAAASNSFAFGHFVQVAPTASYSFAIGHGATSSFPLVNDVPNSLMVGFNSSEPTLMVEGGSGGNAVGNVGIGTKDPQRRLHINGHTLIERDATFWADTKVLMGISSYGANNRGLRFEISSDGGANYIDVLHLRNNGNVGIGTTAPKHKLDVCGTIRAEEVKVYVGCFPDYVFEDNYNLQPLEEVEQYIKDNKHLPNIPDATSIENNGLDMAAMQVKMMEKIEELTLYVIEQDKKIKQLESQLEQE